MSIGNQIATSSPKARAEKLSRTHNANMHAIDEEPPHSFEQYSRLNNTRSVGMNPSADLSIYNFDHEPWRAQAKCGNAEVPEIFFPAQSSSTRVTANGMERLALELCNQCEVRWECLASALYEPFGIRGGFTEEERRAIKKRIRRGGVRGEEEYVALFVEEGMRIDAERKRRGEKRGAGR